MPNVIICGYGEKAEEMKELIDRIMQTLNLQGDAITSIVETKPESCDGERKPMPYLWVRSTSKEEVLRIINAFKAFDLKEDVEYDVIGGFIPASEM